ncbi:TetR/AcrR family transcriptional regulator [bacterium]|nr:TetR/AcrR family transcriptional regulator [bacterium]
MSATLEQRKYAKGLAVRDKLMDAACALFAARGYDGCSVAELAAAAKVSRNQLFHHFGSKENLAVAAIQKAQSHWRDEIITPAAIFPKPTNRLAFVFEKIQELGFGDWVPLKLLAALSAGRAALPAQPATELTALWDELYQFLRRQFKELKRADDAQVGIKARVAAGYVLAVFCGLVHLPNEDDHGLAQELLALLARQLAVMPAETGEAAQTD